MPEPARSCPTPGACACTMSAAPKWECSGCRKQFAGEWQETCPNCGRKNYWTGSFYVTSPDLRAQLATATKALTWRAEQAEAQAEELRLLVLEKSHRCLELAQRAEQAEAREGAHLAELLWAQREFNQFTLRSEDGAIIRSASMRDAIIRAHGMATGRHGQSETERLARIGRLLAEAIDADPVMRGFLGRGGPMASRDILGGSGSLADG